MNRFLLVLIVVVAILIGLGFYLKWFEVGTESSGGKDSMTLTVDENKIKGDTKKARENVQELGSQKREP